ncbi:helix-turn-helix domain-containing protein [Streptomyces sp. NPDC001606]
MSPGERAVERERLAEALRALRAGTGLSLAALAAKTPYSKSSWDRYLSGATLPPRQAVAALCALAGADPGRPLALWELADAVSSGRAAVGRRPGPPSPAPAEPRPRPPREPGPQPAEGAGPARRRLLAGVVGGLAVAGVVVPLAVTGAFGGAAGPGPRTTPSAPAPPWPAAKSCHGGGCTGKDPETYGCGADPVPLTVARQSFSGPTVVKIRHSSACGAVWVRIDLGQVGDRAEILVPHHAPARIEVRDRWDAKDSLSTPMVAASRSDLAGVRACLVRAGERHCFGPDR